MGFAKETRLADFSPNFVAFVNPEERHIWPAKAVDNSHWSPHVFYSEDLWRTGADTRFWHGGVHIGSAPKQDSVPSHLFQILSSCSQKSQQSLGMGPI